MAKRFLTDITVNDSYTFPSLDGTNGQVIQTDGSGTLSFVDASVDSAPSVLLTVKNVSGGSLSKGTIVHISPSASPPSGNVIEVVAADNTSASTMPAIAVLNTTISSGSEGEAVAFGRISGIDTSSFTAGDEVYVGTSGSFSSTKPTGTNYIQKIGVIVRSHATNGTVEIFGAGRSNDVPAPIYVDIPNGRVGVNQSSPSYDLDVTGDGRFTGKIYFANMFSQTSDLPSATTYHGMFAHVHATGKAYFAHAGNWVELLDTNTTLLSGTGSTNKLAFWTGADTLSNNTNLHWDSSNNRLGIGVSSPQETLDVSGFIQSDSIVIDQNSLFINSNQSPNVGLGTNSPSERLDVSGVIKSTGLKVNNNAIYVANSGTNVGIGTSTPNQKFHIYGNSTYSNLFTVTANSVGINTQYPSRFGGLEIANSGLRISNSYGDMDFGQLYSHTDLRVATSTSKFYVSNGSSGPGGPSDTQLAPILVGQIGVKETSPTVAIDAGNATDAIKVPVGTTGERPTGAAGMFRYNSTDGQFEGYTTEWGAIAGSGGGGGGSSTISRDSFSGDGSTVNFTLSASISDEVNTQVYIDGVYQSKLNYSTSGTTLSFSTAPPTGTNNIEVVHIRSVTVDSASTLNKNSFTGDGSTTAFTLTAEPASEDFTFVFVQGVYQEKSTYSLSGTTLTFSTAPQSTYTIEVMHISSVNVQQTSYLEYDSFTGTGSQTDFTLVNGSPEDEKFTMVFIQGVYQEKSTYSLASGVITFSLAPNSGYAIEIMSISGAGVKAVPTVTANDVKYNVSVISSDTNASAGFVYVLTSALTLTLPALPNTGESIKISNRSGVATCVLGANGNNIMGSASDLTLDTASASFELIYSDTTNGWVIIGQ